MSSFTSELLVTPMPDGKYWRLEKEFEYRIGSLDSNQFVIVPKGFITDFASIPKFLWFLPCWAKFNKAPILHDYLYRTRRIMGDKITRKRADDIFLEAMLVEWRYRRSRHSVAWIEYLAVRILGWQTWR